MIFGHNSFSRRQGLRLANFIHAKHSEPILFAVLQITNAVLGVAGEALLHPGVRLHQVLLHQILHGQTPRVGAGPP